MKTDSEYYMVGKVKASDELNKRCSAWRANENDCVILTSSFVTLDPTAVASLTATERRLFWKTGGKLLASKILISTCAVEDLKRGQKNKKGLFNTFNINSFEQIRV